MEALYDAADDDSATGGPDLTRRIWPLVATVTLDGYRRVPDSELASVVADVVAGRTRDPGGSGRRRGGAAMTAPFYVSPEQLMKDRADFARKGIARGRSVVVVPFDGGIAFAAENPSRALHKISEIYDRIAFASVGKYNEFENLRVAGVRYADLRGYSYDRSDVTARGLANAYAQMMGTVFTTEHKPLEVELVVAEVGRTPDSDQVYRLTYDGSVIDERGVVVMGGAAEQVATVIGDRWRPGMTLADALSLAVEALSVDPAGGPSRELEAGAPGGRGARPEPPAPRLPPAWPGRFSSGC